MAALRNTVRLVRRTCQPATLRGLGSLRDHFELGAELGTGRFGVVQLATHRATGRAFAVKLACKLTLESDGDAERMLRNELTMQRKYVRACARAAAASPLTPPALAATRIRQAVGRHPHLCSTFETYEDAQRVSVVLEYLPGGDLFHRVASMGRYTEASAARIVRALALALAALHRCRIVHCDVKPE